MRSNNDSLWLALLGFALLLGTIAPVAATEKPKHDFATCRHLAATNPAQAVKQAQEWQEHGGGDEAEVCGALARFNSGDFAGAGQVFERLAARVSNQPPSQTAEFYDRAAWAWLRAGDANRAEALYTAALEKMPGDPELSIDRAIARAESKHYREAIEDFNAVLKRQPQRADAYLYRAMAYRALNNLKNALEDIEQALHLKPDDTQALLERGTIRALSGDSLGARLDWREVVRRDPTSASGKAAAANISSLDRARGKE